MSGIRHRLKMCQSIQSIGKLKLSENKEYDFTSNDLQYLEGIGRGGFGTIHKMLHRSSDTLMTVQIIRFIKKNEKIPMDLDVIKFNNECPNIVQFYGAVFNDWDCWICMEIMDTSLEKIYKYAYEKCNQRIPENILGKITVASVKALNYSKKCLEIKPSKILLDSRGNIKLCDLGISRHDNMIDTCSRIIVDYNMAPEKFHPFRRGNYDDSSDVWSLGITLVEVATGKCPYSRCNDVFQQLCQIAEGDPPRLQASDNFSPNFVNFVNTCLIKAVNQRPKKNELPEHLFIKGSDAESVDVASYVREIMAAMENNGAESPLTMQGPLPLGTQSLSINNKKKKVKTSKCTLV